MRASFHEIKERVIECNDVIYEDKEKSLSARRTPFLEGRLFLLRLMNDGNDAFTMGEYLLVLVYWLPSYTV